MQSFLSLVKNSKLAKSITSLALGKFDGMHLGHQALFNALDENGAILCIEASDGTLLPRKYREYFTHFPIFCLDLEIVRCKSDREFVGFLLGVLPNLKRIVVGYDFRFGKDRFYYPFDLSKCFNGEVVVVNEVSCKKLSIHSGLIKEMLLNGNVKQANKLLGRMYMVQGSIIQVGGCAMLEDSKEAQLYPAVIFIGNRLSTDKAFAIEGHLLGVSLEVTESEARFYFCKKIRDNRKFESLDLLKAQISADIESAYRILKVSNG